MEQHFFCPNCETMGGTIIKTKSQVFPVRSDKITVTSQVRLCAKCGTDIYDKELDSDALAKAYYMYRAKHKIVGPADIKALRETYGLTQRGLSALLGCGEISIHRYENGSIPDVVHNQILHLIRDPLNLQQILNERSHLLNPRLERKLRIRLTELIAADAPKKVLDLITFLSTQKKPSIENGYKKYLPEKLLEMMVFFAYRSKGVFKTKLNKLLWYSDFLHFHRNAVSISGARYVHLPYGPVPDNYDLCLSLLTQEKTLVREEVIYSPDTVREKLVATRSYDENFFSDSEIKTMEIVLRKLKKFSSKQLSDLSHKEKGYKETSTGDPISYNYAEHLKAEFN